MWSRAAPGEGVCLARFRTVQTAKQAEALRLPGHSIEHQTRPTVPKSALQTCPLGFPPHLHQRPAPSAPRGGMLGTQRAAQPRKERGVLAGGPSRLQGCAHTACPPSPMSLRLRPASPALALLHTVSCFDCFPPKSRPNRSAWHDCEPPACQALFIRPKACSQGLSG